MATRAWDLEYRDREVTFEIQPLDAPAIEHRAGLFALDTPLDRIGRLVLTLHEWCKVAAGTALVAIAVLPVFTYTRGSSWTRADPQLSAFRSSPDSGPPAFP